MGTPDWHSQSGPVSGTTPEEELPYLCQEGVGTFCTGQSSWTWAEVLQLDKEELVLQVSGCARVPKYDWRAEELFRYILLLIQRGGNSSLQGASEGRPNTRPSFQFSHWFVPGLPSLPDVSNCFKWSLPCPVLAIICVWGPWLSRSTGGPGIHLLVWWFWETLMFKEKDVLLQHSSLLSYPPMLTSGFSQLLPTTYSVLLKSQSLFRMESLDFPSLDWGPPPIHPDIPLWLVCRVSILFSH